MLGQARGAIRDRLESFIDTPQPGCFWCRKQDLFRWCYMVDLDSFLWCFWVGFRFFFVGVSGWVLGSFLLVFSMVFVACFSVVCMVVYGYVVMYIMLHGSMGMWKKMGWTWDKPRGFKHQWLRIQTWQAGKNPHKWRDVAGKIIHRWGTVHCHVWLQEGKQQWFSQEKCWHRPGDIYTSSDNPDTNITIIDSNYSNCL